MYHLPFVQPPLTNVGSSFQRPLGIFQDGGVIFRQPRFQGLSLTTWGGKRLISKPSLLSKMVAMSNSPPWGYVVRSKSPPLGQTSQSKPRG